MSAEIPDPKNAWRFLEDSDRVASAQEVEDAIRRVAREIDARLSAAYPIVLVLMRGAVVFAGRLLPLLRFPLEIDYIDLSRYGTETRAREIAWRVAPGESVRGRTVLALDDIVDGGNTLQAVRERVLALGAADFASAVLVEKDTGRPKPIAPDFVGLRVPDRFVFGCGMDARGYWRNLPEIRAMRER
jgi:hypoxanthine phosphoribosyltransferase